MPSTEPTYRPLVLRNHALELKESLQSPPHAALGAFNASISGTRVLRPAAS